MIFLLIIIVIIVSGLISCMTPKWGRTPRGEIMERIEASPNYRDGRFHNQSAEQEFSFRAFFELRRTMRETPAGIVRPSMPIPTMKTDLHQIDRNENIMVWLGHASLFIQVDGIRFLIDPVLVTASPYPFFARPFKGTEVYTPDDIPEIDYLLITHDHWDHLDYPAVLRLRGRIGKVICGLGVGEHFRRWRFNPDDIIELDWNENVTLVNEMILHVLPAQHNSARNFFRRNRTLWVSFMLEAPSSTIYISGDTGYGPHFFDIGKQFSNIDLAIIEFGQWGEGWRIMHIMPDEFIKAINDLNPVRSFAYHNSKYTLARHSWFEPLEIVTTLNEQDGIIIITPMKGELVYLNDFSQEFSLWWRGVN